MKKGKLLLSFLLALLFACCAFACEDAPKFNLSFEADGKVVHTVSTTGVEGVTMPTDPAKEGYSFDGWFFDKDAFAKPFTLEGLAANPIKADTTVYAKFTIIKVLTSIAVTTKPTKLEYRKGTDFDASGIVVTGTYDDGSLAVLTAANYSLDSTAFNKDVIGEYTIAVKLTAKPTVTATFTVSVIKSALSVGITTAATKLAYNVGEDFSATGLAITLTYDDGTSKLLSNSEFTIDSTDYKKALGGEYSIAISLKENVAITTSYTVTVIKVATSIAITTASTKTDFSVGEGFSSTGLTVTLTYNDGTTKLLSSSEFTIDSTAYNKALGGEYSIAISLKENVAITTSYTVTVIKVATSISITTAATKLEYSVGEDFSATGLAVTLTYNHGTTKLLSNGEFTIDSTDYNKALGGEYSIAIRLVADDTIVTSYDVKVIKEFVSIRVKTLPSDEFLNFPLQDEYKPGTITVEEVFNDGTASELDSNKYTTSCDDFNKLKLGEYPVIVSLKGTSHTCTFNVNVVPPPFVGNYYSLSPMPSGEEACYNAMIIYADGTLTHLLQGGTYDYTFAKQASGDYIITFNNAPMPFNSSTSTIDFGNYFYTLITKDMLVLTLDFVTSPTLNQMNLIVLADANGKIPQKDIDTFAFLGAFYLDAASTLPITAETKFTESATIYVAHIVDYTGNPFIGTYFIPTDGKTTNEIICTFTEKGIVLSSGQGGISDAPYTATNNGDGTYTITSIMDTATYSVTTGKLTYVTQMSTRICDKLNRETHSLVTITQNSGLNYYFVVKNGTALSTLTMRGSEYSDLALLGYNNEPITADTTFALSEIRSFRGAMDIREMFGNYEFSVMIFGRSDTSVPENYLIKNGDKYAATVEVHGITSSGELLVTLKSALGDISALITSDGSWINKVKITSGDYIGEYERNNHKLFSGAPFVDEYFLTIEGNSELALAFEIAGTVRIDLENKGQQRGEVIEYSKTATGWDFTIFNYDSKETFTLIYTEANQTMTYNETVYTARTYSKSPFIGEFYYRDTDIYISKDGRVTPSTDWGNDIIDTVTINEDIYTITLLNNKVFIYNKTTDTLVHEGNTYKRKIFQFSTLSYYENNGNKLNINYFGLILVNDILICEFISADIETQTFTAEIYETGEIVNVDFLNEISITIQDITYTFVEPLCYRAPFTSTTHHGADGNSWVEVSKDNTINGHITGTIITLIKISETDYTFTYSFKDDQGDMQTSNGSYALIGKVSTLTFNGVSYITAVKNNSEKK